MRVIILLIIIGWGGAAHAADFRDVEYLRNYDGDTISVNIFNVPAILGRNIGIRVNGIDTPEIHSKCAKEKALALKAKSLVENMLERAKRVDLLNVRRGKYFRIVADVEADGVNIGLVLLQKELAVPYDGGHKSNNWCK